MLRYVIGMGMLAIVCLLFCDPEAKADPIINIGPADPVGGNLSGPGGLGGINAPSLAPGNAALFMCPGVGGAAGILGFGGGYCDFNFQPIKLSATTYGIMHSHCEWGGASPLVEMWNCWRVFPGQPDHPAHIDPDIIPDSMGVPWAIQGPAPSDQWPPPGLAPAQDLLNPQGPAPEAPQIPLPNPPEG